MKKRFNLSLVHKQMERVQQPKWHIPEGSNKHDSLRILNSLTRTKTEFVPLRAGHVSWYSCGPTTYDTAHMGHARNYVSTDINRRLIQDYFGYNVNFVQNVTDIDDKIIIRARQSYLFEKFSESIRQTGVTQEAVAKAKDALHDYAKVFAKVDASPPLTSLQAFSDWKATLDVASLTEKEPKIGVWLPAVENALRGLDSSNTDTFLAGVEQVLLPLLDKEQGASVTDPAVFRDLSAYYEADFDSDMRALNVLPPTVTTRVSEYIPEIISFVKKIVDQGYAYAGSDGSVYFDVQSFENSSKHDYAKLQPWNKGSQSLIEEGEGSLGAKLQTKRNSADFALWKSSKIGEPSWESPWGLGRPGWHIECSVMASYVLGEKIDIHTGGVDLAFPHHDNEIAQSEACFDSDQWVNYFMHTGHMHIEGLKMSKSLKNFITIKEALNLFSARQLRLAFAFVPWNMQLDFKMSLPHVKSYEASLSKFFNNVRALSLESTPKTSKRLGDAELSLLNQLYATEDEVDSAFRDNLSTPKALQSIGSLIQSANEYVSSRAGNTKVEPLVAVARYITHILRILGFRMSNDYGWERETSNETNAEEAALPFVQVLAKFRDQIRAAAIDKKLDSDKVLGLCDTLRDVDLLQLNVSLDDRRPPEPSLVKFITEDEKVEILKQRETLAAITAEKWAKKQQAQAQAAKQEAEKIERAKVPATEMFRGASEYSKFDDQGIPTHDASGEPLSKSAVKKLQKAWAVQDKLHKLHFS